MKIAFQMDPIGAVDINADSTFRLAEEAQARGHELFFYLPDQLAYQEGRITARGHDLTVRRGRATMPILARCARSIWPSSTWFGCVRIRRSTCITSPRPICSTG